MKKILLFLSFASVAFVGYSQQTKLLTAEKHNEYGLVYTLPITSFKIDVVAVKETKVAGPYSKYAKVFTSHDNVIAKDGVEWNIESVNVTPFGIPDKENTYVMQLKPGATTFIGVSEDGMLLSINKEPEPLSSGNISIIEIEGNPISGKEYLEYVNEDFVSAISSYKQAQLLAEEIIEVRDAKLSLTRGTAETMPTDGRQLEIMLESLDKQEKALTNAFTGGSWKERSVKSFIVTPDSEGKIVICNLNPSIGLVSPEQGDGTPLYAEITILQEPELPVDAKGEEKKIPKDAVIYNIPATATLKVFMHDKEFYNSICQLSQFGMEFGLNPAIFTDKKEPSYAIFDSATGALKELGSVK